MTINKLNENGKLTLSLKGRLDTSTSPLLEEIITDLNGINELIYDFSELEYISSAGLRLLLLSQKTMSKKGGMTVTNVNDTINEIFEITGFSNILTIK